MGWMHDILTYVQKDPVYRRWEHQHLTFSMLYAFNENFILPFSHDEVVHGKRSMMDKVPGDAWQKAATLRALYLVHVRRIPARSCCSWASSSASGANGGTTCRSTGTCSTSRCTPGFSGASRDLNRLYRAERALYEVDFEAGGLFVDRLQRPRVERDLARAPRARPAGLRRRRR